MCAWGVSSRGAPDSGVDVAAMVAWSRAGAGMWKGVVARGDSVSQ